MQRFAMIPFALLLLAGCGGGPEFHQVAGKVTFDGQPVVYGAVEFIPDTAKGHTGSAGNADIVEGVYDTARPGGKGLSKGPHIARVTVYPEKPPESSGDETVASNAKPPIVVGYPVEVNIDGPTLDIAVPASAKGFDMFKSSKPAARRGNDP
jgi:hypothetical protein